MKKEEIILDCGCRYRYKKFYVQLPPVLYFFMPCEHHLEKHKEDFTELIGKIMEGCKSYQNINLGEEKEMISKERAEELLKETKQLKEDVKNFFRDMDKKLLEIEKQFESKIT